MRFTELKKNIAGTSESEFDDLDYNKVDTALKSVGVDLKDENGQFRDLDDVFLELAKKWNSLDRNAQRYVATIAAGSRQQSRFIALMENYDRTVELIDTAYNSAGRSSEQFAKYQDTIEYKVQQLSNTWEQFRVKLLNSDTFGGVIVSFNKMLKTITHFDIKQVAGLGIIGATLGKVVLESFINNLKNLSGTSAKDLELIKGSFKGFIRGKVNKEQDPFKTKFDSSSLDQIEIKFRQTSGYTQELDTETKNLIGNYINASAKLDEMTEQYNLQTVGLDTFSEEQLEAALKAEEELKIQKQITQELEEQIAAKTGYNQQTIHTIGQNEDFRKLKPKEKYSAIPQIVGTALSTAITTALVMAISGADGGTIVKTTVVSTLTTLIPIILNEVLKSAAVKAAIKAVFTSGWGIFVAVGIAALSGLIAWLENSQKKILQARNDAYDEELNRLKQIKEKQKELLKDSLNYSKQANQARKEREDIAELKNRYEFLKDKSFLNATEEEEFNEIVDKLNNNYSDLIYSFDENTKEIQFNTGAIQDLTAKLSRQEQNAQAQAKISANQAIFNAAINEETNKNAAENLIDLINSSRQDALAVSYYDDMLLYEGFDIKGNKTTLKEKEILPSYEPKVFGGKLIGQKGAYNRLKTDRQFIEQYFNQLDYDVKSQLGITSKDSYTWEDIEEYLQDKYIKNQNLSPEQAIVQFSNDLFEATEKAFSDEKKINETLNSIRESAATIYKGYQVNGEQIAEEFAEDLGYGVNSENVKAVFDKYKIDSKNNNKNIFNYLSKGNEGVANYARMGNYSQNNLKSTLMAYGFVDENGELDLTGYASIFESEKTFKEGIDNLPQDFLNALESNGFTKDKLENGDKDYIARAIADTITTGYVLLSEDYVTIPPELIEENYNAYKKYLELQKKASTLSMSEYEEALGKIIALMPEVMQNALNQANAEGGTNKNRQAYSSAAQFFGGIGMNEGDYKDLALGVQNGIITSTKGANLSTTESKTYAKNLIELITNSGLDKEGQRLLASLDISRPLSEIILDYKYFISKLEENGVDAKEAIATFRQYIQEGRQGLFNGFTTKVEADALHSNFLDSTFGLQEDYDSLIQAQEEYYKEGSIKDSTFSKLRKENLDKYLIAVEGGWAVNTELVEEAYTKQLNDLTFMYQQAIEEAQSYYNFVQNGNRQITNLGNDEKMFGTLWDIYKEQYGEDSEQIYGLMTGAKEWGQLLSGGFTLEEAATFFKDHQDLLEYYTGDFKEIIQDFIDSGAENWDDFLKNIEENTKAAADAMEQDMLSTLNLIHGRIQRLKEAYEVAEDKVKQLKDKLDDLQDTEKDQIKSLKDAEKSLLEAKEGTEFWKGSLSGLENYTERIKILDRAIEDTVKSLEKVDNLTDAKDLLTTLDDSYQKKTENLMAENMAIKDAIDEYKRVLSNNYGDFISFNQDGTANINYSHLAMKKNDKYKEAFEQEYQKLVELQDKEYENNKTLKEIEEKRIEQYKKYRDDYVKIQDDVISILKEKSKEEIDTTKDKYDALTEADNEYLDALEEAIEKQRKLREQANEYDDLATKEKKLSLLRRDTSGANQKEIQQLEEDIQNDRQKMLDTEIDNVIDNMKELYEKQKEAREAELDYMEAVTENTQYFAEWASNIMKTWSSVEDMQAWYLENDPNAKDMTVERTEQYLDEVKEKYSQYISYAAISTDGFVTNQEQAVEQANSLYQSTETNIANLAQTIQDETDKTVAELIEKAQETRDKAAESLDKTRDKIKETEEEHNKMEKRMKQADADYRKGLEKDLDSVAEYCFDTNKKVAINAMKILLEFAKDMTDAEISDKWGINSDFITAVRNGTEDSYFKSNPNTDNKKVYGINIPNIGVRTFKTEAERENYIKYMESSAIWGDSENEIISKAIRHGNFTRFKQGGLVNYTGPAWVDGTPNKPEAFLNAEDTRRIGEAAQILSDIPIFNQTSNASNAVSSVVGDTTIEVHINIDKLANDYDVDQMIERVKHDIVDVSRSVGKQVILKK